jgi:RNA-directed DNA polymerase
VGIDLAKHVFSVHGVDGHGKTVLKRTVSRSLNGRVNYFHYRTSNPVMEGVKTHAEPWLRIHLTRRHKVKDRGINEGRFPSVDLYRRYGLYKVPTAAGWKSAHALA